MNKFLVVLVVALGLSVAQGGAAVQAADDKPVLTVSGTSYDLEALQKMPVSEIVTSTMWTDGVTKFEGVAAKALLEAAGAQGTTVKASAADGYAVDIPRDDFEKAIVAYKMDGALLSGNEQFGPYWVIYNYDAGLNDELHQGRSIYQLKSLEVK
jgi:hypothetical protein